MSGGWDQKPPSLSPHMPRPNTATLSDLELAPHIPVSQLLHEHSVHPALHTAIFSSSRSQPRCPLLREPLPAQPPTTTPPQALSHIALSVPSQHSSLSDFFLNLFIICLPNQNTNPRGRGILPICLSCSWLCLQRWNSVGPENHLWKESQGHSSWSPRPAPSPKPSSTQHPQPPSAEPAPA